VGNLKYRMVFDAGQEVFVPEMLLLLILIAIGLFYLLVWRPIKPKYAKE
jgi:hypothetical protein